MLKYLYSKNTDKFSINNIAEQKIINETYTNKFYIRSSIVETKEILILDNNYNFFLINKKNIEKHLKFFKEQNLLGKSLQLKEFIYSKPTFFKLNFFNKHIIHNTYISYLKILFLIKKNLKKNITINWPLLIINKGNFIYFFNGLKGFLPRKNFSKLRKLLKKLKQFLSTKQKFLILLKKYKKLILKSLLIKNLKTNKLFLTKHKYKNQILKSSLILKNKKTILKIKK